MRAARKSYVLAQKEVVEPHFIDIVSSTISDRRTGKTYAISAHKLATPLDISCALTASAARLFEGKSKHSMVGSWSLLSQFTTFVAREFPEVTQVHELNSSEIFERYRQVLRQEVSRGLYEAKSAHNRFMRAQTIVAGALSQHRIDFKPINNPFPGIGRAGGAKKHLSTQLFRRILAAAKKDVTEFWSRFEDSKRLKSGTRLGDTVQYVREHWNGVVPLSGSLPTMLDHENEALFHNIVGGIGDIANRLHATRDSLIPFLILISYATAANIESLVDFRRDCLLEDDLLPGSFRIRWWKGRSGEQSVMRSEISRFSAPHLIRQVLAMTEPLIPHVDKRQQNLLFLVRGAGSNGRFGELSPGIWGAGLRKFLLRHKIVDEEGTPITFTFDMIRPSVLAEVYRRTGNIIAVKRFANHRFLATTVRYVVDRVTDSKHDAVIMKNQARLVERIRNGKLAKIGAEPNPAKSNTGLSRGVANDCSNPLDGPRFTGSLCPSWLWPLNDPGLIVADEPGFGAELLRERAALNEARLLMDSRRFELLYGERQAAIEYALSRMTEAVLTHAQILLRLLPPLPSLADE